MHEQDRVGVNIVVTGTAAGVGFAIGGPVGAVAGALVPEIVREITSKRVRDTEAVAERACDLAGFSGHELAEWVKASDRHAAFFMEAIEAAWAALDAHKLRTLGYVLADGMTDEAKLDIDQLVIRTRREMEAGHVKVLATIVEGENPERSDGSWLREHLAARHPGLSEAIDAILASLSGLGCIGEIVGTYGGSTWADTPWGPTDFGRRCLNMIRAGEGLIAESSFPAR